MDSLRPEAKPVQDRPPPGGYPEVPFRRNLPARGLSGAALLVVGATAILGGLYVVAQYNKERRCVGAPPRHPAMADGMWRGTRAL